MASIADQASQILVTKGVATAPGGAWPVFVGRLMDVPDAQLAVYDTPGQSPNPKYLLDFPFFMVMVRGGKDDYDGAYTKMREVKDALLGIDPTFFGSDRWDGVTMQGDINFLRYDQTSRPLWSGNFRVIFEPASNALTSRESL